MKKKEKKKLTLKVDRVNVLDVKEASQVHGGKSGRCQTGPNVCEPETANCPVG